MVLCWDGFDDQWKEKVICFSANKLITGQNFIKDKLTLTSMRHCGTLEIGLSSVKEMRNKNGLKAYEHQVNKFAIGRQ